MFIHGKLTEFAFGTLLHQIWYGDGRWTAEGDTRVIKQGLEKSNMAGGQLPYWISSSSYNSVLEWGICT